MQTEKQGGSEKVTEGKKKRVCLQTGLNGATHTQAHPKRHCLWSSLCPGAERPKAGLNGVAFYRRAGGQEQSRGAGKQMKHCTEGLGLKALEH